VKETILFCGFGFIPNSTSRLIGEGQKFPRQVLLEIRINQK